MKEIRIGLVEYKFMEKAHSHAYRDVRIFFDFLVIPVMKVICGRSEEPLKIAKERFGWEEYETDWRKLIERDDIDMIDIATPPNAHKEIAIEAAKAGKIVFCEKPLAAKIEDAYEMLEPVDKSIQERKWIKVKE